ncbi:MAG: MYXO-CTERM sorting domain-containing protein [Bradymonadaceae bacterium]
MLPDRNVRRILAVSFAVCVTVVLSAGTASAHGAGDTGGGHNADTGGQQADVADAGAQTAQKDGCSTTPGDAPVPGSLAIALVGLAAVRRPRTGRSRTG